MPGDHIADTNAESASQQADYPSIRPLRDASIALGAVLLFLTISGLKLAEPNPRPVFISAFYREPLEQLYRQSISNP